MKTQLCSHSKSEIKNGIHECTICGEHISYMDTSTIYKPGYALVNQNLKFAKIISVILSFLIILLFVSPFINRSEFAAKYFGENAFPLFILTLVVLLSLWQIMYVYTYLLNFYHRFANIFTNIRWEVAAIVIIALLAVLAIIIETINASGLQSGMPVYEYLSGHLIIQAILSVFSLSLRI
ncbi:hypothetical protein D0T84_14100 [Dysgonomonas sp. 521]|uniref:hypothetical protein n=1 Tax=Dysgonomonas sp. 521 TaxID=2302932 RepID=UPI0013D4F9C0|nr:hypothetical protein [Dysgonomonas sp. 521]NDV96036.1 hypothetical protein [Dysgonomonas sp. 521]